VRVAIVFAEATLPKAGEATAKSEQSQPRTASPSETSICAVSELIPSPLSQRATEREKPRERERERARERERERESDREREGEREAERALKHWAFE
jgi:hypothetical protein